MLQTVKRWLFSEGRLLDQARFSYVFEHGKSADVIKALTAYQNEDGGFAHGLEPDFWTPESNPIDTWVATRIIRTLALPKNHPLIRAVLQYLADTPYQENGQYYFRIPSNNNTPHAPWWHYTFETRIEGDNPSASLYGFILSHESSETALYKRTYRAFMTMLERFEQHGPTDMHDLRCYSELYTDLAEIFPLKMFKETLEKQIIAHVEKDSSRWFSTYCARPSQLIFCPASLGYEALESLVHEELALLPLHRNKAGIWDLTWSWADEDKDGFEKAQRAWQSIIAVENLMRIAMFTQSKSDLSRLKR